MPARLSSAQVARRQMIHAIRRPLRGPHRVTVMAVEGAAEAVATRGRACGRIRAHFEARCRGVVEIPFDPHPAIGGRMGTVRG